MTAYLLINHLLNFMAPAALMALLLALFSRFFPGFFELKNSLVKPGFFVQVVVNFAIGVDVLVAGLLLLGRDGKMLTYLTLVLAIATTQWWQLGGGRNGWQSLKNLYRRPR
jgi:hypothetical protein